MDNPRAIFFDAVGTLIHPEPAAPLVYAEAGWRFGSQYALPVIAQRFADAFQKQEAIDRNNGWSTSEERELARWRDIVATVLDDVDDPSACFDFLYAHFGEPESWRCEPGAEILFDELRARGYVLGLASNFDGRLHALAHRVRPLQYLAENCVVSYEVGYRKPAPEFFEAMCRRTGFEAAQILHVGDDPGNDYRGAEATGMHALLFDPDDKHPDWAGSRLRQLGDLAAFLEDRPPVVFTSL